LVSGLTKINPNNGKLEYKNLAYVVKFENKIGKVITIQFDLLDGREGFGRKRRR